MANKRIGWWIVASLAAVAAANAQEKQSPTRAAVVNGEPILEATVQRALRKLPKGTDLEKARSELLAFFVDNVLIDQHVKRQNVEAAPPEVEERIKELRNQAADRGQDFDKILQDLAMRPEELRQIMAADLRWEKYAQIKTVDPVLPNFFKANKDWFDGSQVRARHVLVQHDANASAQAKSAARLKLEEVRKRVDAAGAEAAAKASPPERGQARLKAMEEAFAAAAGKDSDCPSSKSGGDLGWFPRIHSMVEPFANAAFALEPGQLSGVVETQFGSHLILCTGRMPGKDVKFEDVKDEVREVVVERLRLDLLPGLRAAAKIEIFTAK